MANTDRPNGFRPAQGLINGDWMPKVRLYQAADRSADTTGNHGDIGIGDPVKFSSGKIVAANSGDTIVGVVVGVGATPMFGNKPGMFNPTNLEQLYLKHSDTGYVWVCPAEGVVFEVQSASDLDYVAGGTADITNVANTAHVDRTTGYSNCELTTTSNQDVTIVDILQSEDNDSTLANTRYLVKFKTVAFAV